MKLRDGDEMGGRYLIKEELGSGSFGYVYHAFDKRLKRDVALKIPKDQEIDFEKFLKEPRLLSRFKHPNINFLWDVAEEGKMRFMVIDYCDRGNLRERINHTGFPKPLPFDETIDIIRQVCLGLKAAHSKGVFHRDIKPENILFDGEDHVAQISDFGISKVLNPDEKSLTIAGSRPYMAPEIVGREGGGFYSDIWSLMIMFYEMLSGKLPFANVEETILKKDVAPPSQVNCSLKGEPVFSEIDILITKEGLNRNTDARITAAEVIQRLETYERKRKISEHDKYEKVISADYDADTPDIDDLFRIRPERQSFAIRVWVDLGTGNQTRDIKVVRRNNGYRVGDRITIKFAADVDCYLTLLNIGTSGAVTRIFPNKLHQDNFIQKGRTYRIPEDEHGFDYELTVPPGLERLKAIATLKPVDRIKEYFVSEKEAIFSPFDSSNISMIFKRVSGLPKGAWAEDRCEFRVG